MQTKVAFGNYDAFDPVQTCTFRIFATQLPLMPVSALVVS
jgi:hypothetical protein